MSSIPPSIFSKIKKCLALSASPNPTEAATAMRQANALMQKYGVTQAAIAQSEIGEAETPSRTLSRDKPAQWEARLVGVIGKAFGCQLMMVGQRQKRGYANEGRYVFVGLKHQAEVAAYTAEVLIRKCKATRAKWLEENFGGLGRGIPGAKARMTRMGDAFAEGWVVQIHERVHAFANPEGIDAAISAHVCSRTSSDDSFETRGLKKIGNNEKLAAYAGMLAAKDEHLYRPCSRDEESRLLEAR